MKLMWRYATDCYDQLYFIFLQIWRNSRSTRINSFIGYLVVLYSCTWIISSLLVSKLKVMFQFIYVAPVARSRGT
jgi:hypothetical protein